MRTGIANRAGLDPPSLTPADEAPGNTKGVPSTGTPYGDSEPFAVGPDGVRTSQLPLAPGMMQEYRVVIADRGSPVGQFSPGAAYANGDAQRGGAPGLDPATGNVVPPPNPVTSETPEGVTVPNGVPVSSRKLSYGWSDYSGHMPTFVGAHIKIQNTSNPNSARTNVTPFNLEGPSQNTQYSTPAPFAAGTFIG